MIIVNLVGGVGNQMFQYALGRCLSVYTKMELLLNVDLYEKGLSNRNYGLDIFTMSTHKMVNSESVKQIVDNSDLPLLNIHERFFHYDGKLIAAIKQYLFNKDGHPTADLSISGYWQSYKYFLDIERLLRRDFRFVNPINGKWKSVLNSILESESVMINIRRTDYLQKLEYHGVVSMDYIMNGIEHFKKHVNSPKFFVFSDDLPWCRQNLANIDNLHFVGEEYYDPKYQYYLQLMSSCKHFIISNSSFAWWSAWLSKNADKIVIAPSVWFTNTDLDTKDLLPPNWLKI